MSVMNMWTVCDRCGFNYKRRNVYKETTGYVVCKSCFDGAFDLKSHPQNRAPHGKVELRPVRNGRAPNDLTQYLILEGGGYINQEGGGRLVWTNTVWTPALTMGY